jgi:hypothetical protein
MFVVAVSLSLLCFGAWAQSSIFPVENNVWESSECTGAPITILRYTFNISLSNYGCTNVTNTTCRSTSTGFFQKGACPTSLEDRYSTAGNDLYLKLTYMKNKDCSGEATTRFLYLADGKCRKSSATTWLSTSCSPDKTATLKSCTDAACSSCNSTLGYDGDINTCWTTATSTVGVKFRCAAANSASSLQSSGILILALAVLALL